ncbi:MAG: type II toxin-antitoxin system HicB family antitoxin [Gemmataceae bacterium]
MLTCSLKGCNTEMPELSQPCRLHRRVGETQGVALGYVVPALRAEDGGTVSPSRYSVRMEWSKRDDAYIAMVPELPGCAADGPTRREALAEIEVVMREWIETATELGREIPEPRGG